MPAELTDGGGRFLLGDRSESLPDLLADGADLVVDCLCFTADDATSLNRLADVIGSVVMISSKAVYIDEQGRHVNSAVPPQFANPLGEDHPTLSPRGDVPFDSPAGYGANKVAAEIALLDGPIPTTVLRASKVHGRGGSRPREWVFLKRILDRRRAVFFNQGGAGGDHPTAAANLASLIGTVSARPGNRILNSADPDAPTGRDIARVIAGLLGHHWEEVVVDHPGRLGDHPWNFVPAIRLDLSKSQALGYRPVGTYSETVTEEIDWMLNAPDRFWASDPYFDPFFSYEEEDEALASSGRTNLDSVP